MDGVYIVLGHHTYDDGPEIVSVHQTKNGAEAYIEKHKSDAKLKYDQYDVVFEEVLA